MSQEGYEHDEPIFIIGSLVIHEEHISREYFERLLDILSSTCQVSLIELQESEELIAIVSIWIEFEALLEIFLYY